MIGHGNAPWGHNEVNWNGVLKSETWNTDFQYISYYKSLQNTMPSMGDRVKEFMGKGVSDSNQNQSRLCTTHLHQNLKIRSSSFKNLRMGAKNISQVSNCNPLHHSTCIQLLITNLSE